MEMKGWRLYKETARRCVVRLLTVRNFARERPHIVRSLCKDVYRYPYLLRLVHWPVLDACKASRLDPIRVAMLPSVDPHNSSLAIIRR